MAASVMPQLASMAGILAGEAQRGEEEFREDMARACLLTAYIKRRCNLILKTAEQEELSPEELCADFIRVSEHYNNRSLICQ